MSDEHKITHKATIRRKADSLPRYFEVPAGLVARWNLTGTTVVEAELNGISVGRRSLKRWDDTRWFLDLPETLCRRAQVNTGDQAMVRLRLADEALPGELVSLIRDDPRAARAWRSMTESRRRMVREHVLRAKRAATRERRARGMLLHECD